MSLTWVRHTQPDIAPGICYGATDLDVSPSFPEEAHRVAQSLDVSAAAYPQFIVSSPLKRCRLLAKYLGTYFKLDVQIDARIREMDFGAWEGMLWAEIPRDELDMWSADFLHARPHGGESVAMLRDRVLEAIADYRMRDMHCVLVTHNGVIKAAFAKGDEADDFSSSLDFGAIIVMSDIKLEDR